MSAGKSAAETTRAAPAAGRLSWRDPRLLAAILLLIVAALGAAWLARPLGTPADLLAVWVAGEFWQMGRVDEIYPPAEGLFTLLPPASWVEFLAETEGYGDSVYPFLYPPLWAVVMGVLAPSSFGPVAEASYWVNAALLAATVVLAIRATGAGVQPVLHAGLVLAVFFTTLIASVGYLQGQPHILVTFLIVLAIERSRAGSGTAAGVALALAASIKLFPALYAVIWLARGERRALAAFVAAGLGLATLSVIVAGWHLHRAFLDSVGQIGGTLLVIGKSMSFDAIVAELFLADTLEVVRGQSLAEFGGLQGTWQVAPRPVLWAILANAGLLIVLAGSAFAARRLDDQRLYAGLWPFLLTFSVLFTPTGWIYYMLPAAVFAPAMLSGANVARGGALFGTGLLLFYASRLAVFQELAGGGIGEVYFYVAGTIAWGVGFARVAFGQGDE